LLRDRLVVLDAGNGFYKLPLLMKRLGVSRADVFLSHLHLDHASGLLTLPLLERGMGIRIFVHKSYLSKLRRLVAHPYAPAPGELWAKVTLHSLSTGENRVPYGVCTLPLDHADPCFGYCFSLQGKKIAYCTDTGPCKNISRLASGADALITECTLLMGQRPNPGWPHMSPGLAAREAKKAGVKRLILTHFDASKYLSMAMRLRAQEAARRIFSKTIAAMDGMEIEV
jgi:ribonuclease BN (tRNA processing enzyme)